MSRPRVGFQIFGRTHPSATQLPTGICPSGWPQRVLFRLFPSSSPTLASILHFSPFLVFSVIFSLTEPRPHYSIDLIFSRFHFFFTFSGEKRVLHYTYNEGAPLPARQNKALEALFFMPYSWFAFLFVFPSSFSIIFRIYSPTLGHEKSKTGSSPIAFLFNVQNLGGAF